MAPTPRPVADVAAGLGLAPADVLPFGPDVLKLAPSAVARLQPRADARLVLVSAITPTSSGEGKTTMSIALADGLSRRGRRAAVVLRQPSLGPTLGAKGGATGGGKARVVPSDRIELHFTGDLHAVTAAHDLLASLVDNALHHGAVDLDPRTVRWRRVIDLDDRALREIVVGLGGRANGVPREDGFDITAASEVLAILGLARDVPDLKARLGRILVGTSHDRKPVTAADLGAVGPMAALLRDARLPNLVQTAEGTPAFVHGGPFANIAHGAASVVALRAATATADVVVTEAGFAFELGGEKFFDLVVPAAGVAPSAVVLVATVRALAHHGGAHLDSAGPAGAGVVRGMENLDAHVAAVRRFGLEPVVCVNVFDDDAEADLRAVEDACKARGLAVARCDAFARGGEGALALADVVLAAPPAGPVRRVQDGSSTVAGSGGPEPDPVARLEAVARDVYGAKAVVLSPEAERDLERVRRLGYADLPVCVAKTPLSLSADPTLHGRPTGFDLPVRALRIAAGAGWLVALTGDVVTMPGLPAEPHALRLDLDQDGHVTGL